MKRRYRRILISLFIIMGLIPLGYLSAFLSLHACERHTARWIAYDIYEGQQFFVLTPTGNEAIPLSNKSEEIFRDIGADYRVYDEDSEEFGPWPWGDIHPAKIGFPFVVTVRFGYVGAPLSGEGGDKIYLCFFGIAVPFGYHSGWVT